MKGVKTGYNITPVEPCHAKYWRRGNKLNNNNSKHLYHTYNVPGTVVSTVCIFNPHNIFMK